MMRKFDVNTRGGSSGRSSRFGGIPSKLIFFLVGIASTIWFLIRVIPKPSRATYPCMRVAAPWASAFVIYLLGISFSAFSLRKLIDALRKAKYGRALLLLAIGLTIPLVTVPFLRSDAYSAGGSVSDLEPPNTPMGAARGIFPGRVVWVLDTASTNEHCTNAYGDGYFLHKNTSQQVVDLS